MIKSSPERGHRGNIPQHNTVYNKPTANLILNSEKLKAFHLRSRTKQGCPLLPLLFNMVLTIRKKRKDIQIGRDTCKTLK